MRISRIIMTIMLALPILLMNGSPSSSSYAGAMDLDARLNDPDQTLAPQDIVSRWEGVLTPAPLRKQGASTLSNGLTFDFDITYDDDNVPIHFDYDFSAIHATMNEDDEVVCYSGDQVSRSRRAETFGPLGDDSFLVMDNFLDEGGFFQGWAIQGATLIEGGVVIPDQATGNLLLYYDIQFGTHTCNFEFQATCVENCIAGPPTLSFSQPAYVVREDEEQVTITVNRSGNRDQDVQVDLVSSDGTALAGEDYTSYDETLTFLANESSQTIDIEIDADLEIEGEETFNLTLLNPTNGAELGAVHIATVTIDDRPDLTLDPFELPIENLQLDGNAFVLPNITVVARNLAEDGPSLTGVVVRFTAGETVVHEEALAELGPGETSTFSFDWDFTSLVTASSGNVDLTLVGTIDPANTYEETNEANNVQTATGSLDLQPRITGVNPQYTLDGHYFLDNQSVSNQITVLVDWNGDLPGTGDEPGQVHFNLNGAQVIENGTATGAVHTYDMGSDFDSSLACANNTLEIWASKSSINSDSVLIQPTVFPFPEWVEWVIQNIPGSASDFDTTPNAPVVEYAYEFQYPEPAFEAIWDVPSIVPYLGGKQIGILESQATANALGRSDGIGEVGLSGTTGLGLAAVDLAGTIGGVGEVQFKCAESLDLLATTLTLNVNATFSRDIGVAELFPPLAAAENWWAVGSLIQWFNESAEVSASLTPEVEIETTFVDNANDELEFEEGSGTGTIAAEASLTVNPISGIEASVTGGGSPYVTVQVPADPGYLEEVGIDLSFEAALVVLGLGFDYTTEVNCNSNGGCSVDDGSRLRTITGPTIIPRDYATMAAYDTFAPTVEIANSETILLTNIYPHPQPALAVRADGQQLLATIHDAPSAPAGRGTELRVLHYDGASWQPPVNVTNDAQPDYNPSLTFDSAGNGVVVWERATLTTGITPSLNVTYTNSFEIYSSLWNGSGWSVPITLTSNALMDYAPQVTTGHDGAVMAAWQTNDGTDMMGTVTHPVTINTALWNGAAWSGITATLTGQTGVVQSALAVYSATQASLVLTKLDGGDTELYYATYNGVTWNGLVQITTNGVSDDAPQLIYDAAGNRHLVWRQDRQVLWLKNSWDVAQAQVILSSYPDGGLIEMDLTSDAVGNLALVWPALGQTTPEIMGMIYHSATDSWSAVQTLTESSAVEGSLTAKFDPDGALAVGYRSTARVYGDAPNGAVNVPTLGASNLAFLTHPLGRDLMVETMTISPTNPAPGDSVTMSVVLQNAGALTVIAPQLQFHDGVIVLVTQTLPNLNAGTTITPTFTWSVPVTASHHTLQVVADPNGQVVETNEGNNEAQVTTTLPDIVIDLAYTMYVSDGVTVTTKLRNDGVLDIDSSFDVTLRAGNLVSGTLLGPIVVPTLAAGDTFTTSQYLASASLAGLDVDRVWVVADSMDTITEANETNNTAAAALTLLPDLALSAQDIQGGVEVISLTVHNRGLATATNVLLWHVASADLPTAETVANTSTIASIPAGESRVVLIAAPVSTATHAIALDPNNTIAEISESNNVAKHTVTTTKRSIRIFLPLVRKS